MLKLTSKQIVLPIAALLLIAGSAFAQPPRMGTEGAGKERIRENRGEHRMMIPDPTEQQEEQMKALQIEHMQTIQPLRNQLGEKKARLRTLTTGDNVNMTEVNKAIDEIGRVETQMTKIREQHRQDIRKLLTEEQRVFFDSQQPPHDGRPHTGGHSEKGPR